MRIEPPNVCCFCGKDIFGYGNDPWPVKYGPRCCDKCNIDIVIPARLKRMMEKDNGTEQSK